MPTAEQPRAQHLNAKHLRRQDLLPGDEVRDCSDNYVLTHPCPQAQALVTDEASHEFFLRAVRGKISADEYARTLLHRASIKTAYDFGHELPEGTTIIRTSTQEAAPTPSRLRRAGKRIFEAIGHLSLTE